MSFSPIAVGDTSPIHNTFATDSGVFSLSGLSTSNLAMHYQEQPNGQVRVGSGTWTITNVTQGLADYTPSSTDVGTPGTYKVYPVITLPSGAPKAFDAQVLEILNLT
jgi:hypothetical protein